MSVDPLRQPRELFSDPPSASDRRRAEMFSAVGLNEAKSCGLLGQVGRNPQVSLDQMRARGVLSKVNLDRRRQARGGEHPHHCGSGNLRLVASCLWQHLHGTVTGQGNCAGVASRP
jgi:hypothetical protein